MLLVGSSSNPSIHKTGLSNVASDKNKNKMSRFFIVDQGDLNHVLNDKKNSFEGVEN